MPCRRIVRQATVCRQIQRLLVHGAAPVLRHGSGRGVVHAAQQRAQLPHIHPQLAHIHSQLAHILLARQLAHILFARHLLPQFAHLLPHYVAQYGLKGRFRAGLGGLVTARRAAAPVAKGGSPLGASRPRGLRAEPS